MKNHPLNRLIRWFWPKPKKRVELIEKRVKEITKDLLTSGFSNTEIAIIAKTVCSDIKTALQDRETLLINELNNTREAIKKL